MGSRAEAPSGIKKETSGPRPIKSLQTVSLRKRAEEQAVGQNTNEERILLNQPFTTEALLRAWNIFIETIRDDAHLINAMRTYTPVLGEDYLIQLTVPNQPLEQKFLDLTISIERHLHKTLQNNRIRLVVTLAEGEESGRPFTAREKLDAMIQKNPIMEILYRTLNLDLN